MAKKAIKKDVYETESDVIKKLLGKDINKVNLITQTREYEKEVVEGVDKAENEILYGQHQRLQFFKKRLSKEQVNVIWCDRGSDYHPYTFDNDVRGAIVAADQEGFLSEGDAHVVFPSALYRQDILTRYPNVIPDSQAWILKDSVDPVNVTEEDKKGRKVRIVWTEDLRNGLGVFLGVCRNLQETVSGKTVKNREGNVNILVDVIASSESEVNDPAIRRAIEYIENPDNGLSDVVKFHGVLTNKARRKIVRRAHIWVFSPVVGVHSSRMLLEALSAGCYVVLPDNGSHVELTGDFGLVYTWSQDPTTQAQTLFQVLVGAVRRAREQMKGETYINGALQLQKFWVDNMHNSNLGAMKWKALLDNVRSVYDTKNSEEVIL